MSSFSEWMRDNLLNSWEGLITQDIDYLIFNDNFTSFVLLEEKNSERAKVNIGQAIIFKFLDEFLSLQNNIQFYGSFLIYALQNGNIYINPELTRQGNSWSYGVVSLEQSIGFNEFRNLVCNNQNQLQNNYYRDWWNPIVDELVDNLYDCEGDPPNFTTRRERTGYRGTNLCNICPGMKKIDWIFVNYCTGCFLLLEEKTFSNGNYRPNYYESNLIQTINSVFENSNNQNLSIQEVINPRSRVPYKYLGYFLIEFDHNTPDDSQNRWLNHQSININDLRDFLNLNSDRAEEIANRYRTTWW